MELTHLNAKPVWKSLVPRETLTDMSKQEMLPLAMNVVPNFAIQGVWIVINLNIGWQIL